MNVALVQFDIVWRYPEKNFQFLNGEFDKLSDDTDLVVLPEMFATGFTMNPENLEESGQQALQWMQEKAMQYDLAVTGSVIWSEGGRFYNRLYFVFPDGSFKYYDKRHSFTLAGEDAHFTSGEERLLVEYRGFVFCPMICYDLRFPVWSRNTAPYYDVLLYVANWPEQRIHAWDTLLKARAIENLTYVIGVNRVGKDKNKLIYTGHSSAYDFFGRQICFSTEREISYIKLNKTHT